MLNMNDHSIMVDLDDPRISGIADVIANKSCKRILSLLSEKELSETDISNSLGMPINTVGYNIKKLFDAGLIEKSKNFFWSSKGKKINTYKLSNKRIVISPKSSLKGIFPAIVVSIFIAFGINILFKDNGASTLADTNIAAKGMAYSEPAFSSGIYYTLNNASNAWAWFLIGALSGLLIFVVWNWRKYVK